MRQSVENQRGEIEFRKQLADQHVHGSTVFADEYNTQEIEAILDRRMQETAEVIRDLQLRGTSLSPYLEIGAERGQRSLVLENDFDASGAAADISFDMLTSCDHYRKVFNRSDNPLRACCDVYNLPFRSNSIPFVFCYQTLHHFPDLSPVVNEVERVLAPGGTFLFAEEPYQQVLRLALYRTREKTSTRKGVLRYLLDRFFSESVCTEEEYGILENHDIPLRRWRDALSGFAKKDVRLVSLKFLRADLFGKRALPYFFAYLLGGTISGICQKPCGEVCKGNSIQECLICPCCKENECESVLQGATGSWECETCSRMFPTIDGVSFFFTDEKLRELYPTVFRESSIETRPEP